MKTRCTFVILAMAAMFGAFAPAAFATGPCGNDFDGNSACALNSPYSASGTIASNNESDYYVFHAAKNTQINVTATDTESPSCSLYDSGGGGCGSIDVVLDDSHGNSLASPNESSQPNNGITIPAPFSYVIGKAGTYYLVVQGETGVDTNGNARAVPYALNVTATPGVVWPYTPPPPTLPPPAPPQCVIPAAHGKTVATVKRLLIANHCRVGRTYWRRHTGVRRGRVVALGRGRGKLLVSLWRPGTTLSNGTVVALAVSRGR
jgi:hypothetical protein